MSKLNVLFFLLAGITLAVLHFISLELYLYWRFTWLDTAMHFLAGSVISLGLFTGYALKWPVPKRWLQFVPVFSIVLIIALAWEVWGLYLKIPIPDNYALDTVADLLAGLAGGSVGYLVGRKFMYF